MCGYSHSPTHILYLFGGKSIILSILFASRKIPIWKTNSRQSPTATAILSFCTKGGHQDHKAAFGAKKLQQPTRKQVCLLESRDRLDAKPRSQSNIIVSTNVEGKPPVGLQVALKGCLAFDLHLRGAICGAAESSSENGSICPSALYAQNQCKCN